MCASALLAAVRFGGTPCSSCRSTSQLMPACESHQPFVALQPQSRIGSRNCTAASATDAAAAAAAAATAAAATSATAPVTLGLSAPAVTSSRRLNERMKGPATSGRTRTERRWHVPSVVVRAVADWEATGRGKGEKADSDLDEEDEEEDVEHAGMAGEAEGESNGVGIPSPSIVAMDMLTYARVRSRKDFRPASRLFLLEVVQQLNLSREITSAASAAIAAAAAARARRDIGSSGGEDKGGVELVENVGIKAAADQVIHSLSMSDQEVFESACAVVTFLYSIWLNRVEIREALATCPGLLQAADGELQQRADYFVARGCTPGELGSATRRQPQWLLTPLERIQDTAAFLEGSGFSSERAARLMLQVPTVMGESEVEKIVPRLALLQDLVGPDGSVDDLLERQPGLLEIGEDDVARRWDMLLDFMGDPGLLGDLVQTKPGILFLGPEALGERFANLRSIFTPRRLRNVFKVAPGILLLRPERLQLQLRRLSERLTPDIAIRVANAFPQALTLNWERVVSPKLDYLEHLGLDPQEVVNFPAYLGYSLSSRIRPRCEALRAAGYEIRPHDEVITTENEKKLRKHGRSHRDLLAAEGWHAVCIQHIVGLRDSTFEMYFGVRPDSKAAAGGYGVLGPRGKEGEEWMLKYLAEEVVGADEEEVEEDGEGGEREGEVFAKGRHGSTVGAVVAENAATSSGTERRGGA